MEDENIDLDEGQKVEEISQENNRQLNRTKDLADKLRHEREEREKIAQEKQKLEAERESAKKEVEFYKGFSTVVGKYAEASTYQDQIREKVLNGYDIEDATISILAREGKFGGVPKSAATTTAGGSATNNFTSDSKKHPSEMNADELRSAILEAEKRGDIYIN